MKNVKLLLLAITMIASYSLTAQIAVTNDGTSPDGSAMLDVKSTDKGLLPPRMTMAQRDAINSPVAGLMLWCNNCGASGELQVYNGTEWVNVIGGAASSAFICGTSTMTDTDGNTYNTVAIGTQCWMAENLNYATDNSWWYENNGEYGDIYGRLYTWTAALTACPDGWHLPTDDEWTTLTDYLGGENVAGGKLKETGTTHWLSPNTGATNSSGFTALPAGFRYYVGVSFNRLGLSTYWWSATAYSSAYAWGRDLSCNGEGAYLYHNYKD